MITTGIPLLMALVTGSRSALSSVGASTIPETPRPHESLDFCDLGLAIVLARRALPNHLDSQLLRGFLSAGVNGLPERMARGLRDDGDGNLLPARTFLRARAAAGGQETREKKD